MLLGPVSEFEHTVIEYVARDGGSNGALGWKIGFEKPGSGHKILSDRRLGRYNSARDEDWTYAINTS